MLLPASSKGSGTVSAADPVSVDTSWFDRLPQFCDAYTVAQIFDITVDQARRWMGKDEKASLPRARRPDGKYVTSRAHVIALARRMYGEMGVEVNEQATELRVEPGCQP